MEDQGRLVVSMHFIRVVAILCLFLHVFTYTFEGGEFQPVEIEVGHFVGGEPHSALCNGLVFYLEHYRHSVFILDLTFLFHLNSELMLLGSDLHSIPHV